jgi:hypothetical protein
MPAAQSRPKLATTRTDHTGLSSRPSQVWRVWLPSPFGSSRTDREQSLMRKLSEEPSYRASLREAAPTTDLTLRSFRLIFLS